MKPEVFLLLAGQPGRKLIFLLHFIFLLAHITSPTTLRDVTRHLVLLRKFGGDVLLVTFPVDREYTASEFINFTRVYVKS